MFVYKKFKKLFLLFNNHENIHNPPMKGFQITPLPLWIPILFYTLIRNNLRSRPQTPLGFLGEAWIFSGTTLFITVEFMLSSMENYTLLIFFWATLVQLSKMKVTCSSVKVREKLHHLGESHDKEDFGF